MPHLRSSRLVEITICLCFAVSTWGQNPEFSASSRGKTSAEELTALSIDLSEPSLLDALSNTSPRVRWLAAGQLLAGHHVDATSAIERALSVERDPMTRVGMATSLAGFHDPQGIEHLQTMCADTTVPIQPLISAAQSLENFNSSNAGCTDVLLDDLTNDRDKDYRNTTVTLFPALYKESTPEQAARIVNVIETVLADKTQDSSVRLVAGNTLAEIGSPSSQDAMMQAISQAENPVLRKSLERNLSALEKKKPSSSQ
jgi:HEAT repeat protein